MFTYELKESDYLLINIDKDITSTTAESIQKELDEIIRNKLVWQKQWANLVLDLTTIEFIDSIGLNMIIMLIKAMKLRPAAIELRIVSSNLYELFMYTRLNTLVKVNMLRKTHAPYPERKQ